MRRALLCATVVCALLDSASAAAAVWTTQPVPVPTVNRLEELTAVSCGSANACVAVGNATSVADGEVTVGEEWDGSQWTLLPQPASVSPGSFQGSVFSGRQLHVADRVSCGRFVAAGFWEHRRCRLGPGSPLERSQLVARAAA